jgi:hypothetical protein
MAPYQRINALLGANPSESLGITFATEANDHLHELIVVDPHGQAANSGLSVGDFIIGINHSPLSSALTHDQVATMIRKVSRPFTLNVARKQTTHVADGEKLSKQNRDWFIGYCKRCRIEKSVIEGSLRLQRATKSTMEPRHHLILCLRVMAKYVDDFLGVTNLSIRAGAVKTDDEWADLEIDICSQVHWNLRFFCFSSRTKVAAADATKKAKAPPPITGRSPDENRSQAQNSHTRNNSAGLQNNQGLQNSQGMRPVLQQQNADTGRNMPSSKQPHTWPQAKTQKQFPNPTHKTNVDQLKHAKAKQAELRELKKTPSKNKLLSTIRSKYHAVVGAFTNAPTFSVVI